MDDVTQQDLIFLRRAIALAREARNGGRRLGLVGFVAGVVVLVAFVDEAEAGEGEHFVDLGDVF
jgi:hypothetical protein